MPSYYYSFFFLIYLYSPILLRVLEKLCYFSIQRNNTDRRREREKKKKRDHSLIPICNGTPHIYFIS